MKTLAAGLAMGMAVALAGCALPEPKTDGELLASGGAATTNNAAGQDGHLMTGSRIAKRTSTDRSLKTVGARNARDAMEQAPRPLSATGG